jgi:hypothetical protein
MIKDQLLIDVTLSAAQFGELFQAVFKPQCDFNRVAALFLDSFLQTPEVLTPEGVELVKYKSRHVVTKDGVDYQAILRNFCKIDTVDLQQIDSQDAISLSGKAANKFEVNTVRVIGVGKELARNNITVVVYMILNF